MNYLILTYARNFELEAWTQLSQIGLTLDKNVLSRQNVMSTQFAQNLTTIDMVGLILRNSDLNLHPRYGQFDSF